MKNWELGLSPAAALSTAMLGRLRAFGPRSTQPSTICETVK